jgi:glycosyltransferase involved in cell wall biosynthesis
MGNRASQQDNRTIARSCLYIDMAYTLAIVEAKGHGNFFETRHSGNFFDRVWGVHPLADRAGADAGEIRSYRFSPRQMVIEGVSRMHRWPKLLAPFDFLQSQARLAIMLADIVRRENIDIIIATDAIYSGLFGRVLKAMTGRPLVIGIFADFDFAFRSSGALAMPKLIPSYRLQNLIARFVLRNADLVIGGTRCYLEWGRRHGARDERGVVVPIARYVEPCHQLDPAERGDPGPLLSELGVPPDSRPMIMTSRLIPLKFADDGVRAMIEAARLDPKASGIVAGSGSLRPALESMVAEAGLTTRIRFAGHLSQQQLSLLLPRCITLSPLTGMALVESGLGGSPVIAYDADWQPEFVEDGVSGFIVPTRDWRAMGRKAAQLVSDETLRNRMGQAMRASAIARADRARIAATEAAIFAALLDGRPMAAEWR